MTPMTQPGDQSAQMGQMMNLYMPFFMGYLALTFAAGLSLYFITTNVITVAQYAIMGKVDWSNLTLKNLIPKFSLPRPATQNQPIPTSSNPSTKQTASKTIHPRKKKKSGSRK
jgi:YidC/Oxa1 family membrane protein insertase